MKILLLDIETAPSLVFTWNFWNTSITMDKMVEPGHTLCWSARWLGDKEKIFASVPIHGKDAMIHIVWQLLDEADAVIHYNGTKFDIPTLNREFVLRGMTPPSPYHQIDLYKTVKRNFKFAYNSLDYVCQQLGIGNKLQHKGMKLWRDCMDGDPEAWQIMEEYNKIDVDLLIDLYYVLQPWIQNHPNYGLYVDSKAPVCPNCGSTHLQKRGTRKTTTQMYQQYACMDCGSWPRGRNTILPKEQREIVLRGTA